MVNETKYDLIVIGGGPAGMMAAGRAGELGKRVMLIEKNSQTGVKLLLTGKERCNLTNNLSASDFIKAFGSNGNFLFYALANFTPSDTISFFESRGVKIKIEANNRAFPVSDRAQDVLDVLLKYLKEAKVEIKTKAAVKNIVAKNGLIEKIILVSGEELKAKKYLIATGGLAYPGSGSTGDAYSWLANLGHRIIKPVPALTPIILQEKFIKNLEGLSFKARFNFVKDSRVGEAIFTGNGLSGPAILAMSGLIARQKNDFVDDKNKLSLDFFPNETVADLDLRLRNLFVKENRKQLKNVLTDLLPGRLVEVVLSLAKLKSLPVNEISKVNRQKLVKLIKNFELEVAGVGDFNKAMMTNGGVSVKEVDQKTMRSKLVNNLYLAGEILDLDGPTGGFNLQACWSTGKLAGESAIIQE